MPRYCIRFAAGPLIGGFAGGLVHLPLSQFDHSLSPFSPKKTLTTASPLPHRASTPSGRHVHYRLVPPQVLPQLLLGRSLARKVFRFVDRLWRSIARTHCCCGDDDNSDGSPVGLVCRLNEDGAIPDAARPAACCYGRGCLCAAGAATTEDAAQHMVRDPLSYPVHLASICLTESQRTALRQPRNCHYRTA